jgi:hypothetical protein
MSANRIVIDDDASGGKMLTIRTLTQEQMNEVIDLLYVMFEVEPPKNFKPKHLAVLRPFEERLNWDEHLPKWEIRQELLEHPKIEIKIARTPERLQIINEILAPCKITARTKGVLYPERPEEYTKDWNESIWESKDNTPPKYPIYILSKGRWEKRQTSRYLEWCNIPYRIVVEPQEVENYVASGIDRSKILILPDEYLNKNQGGIPARNFIWRHSTAEGHKRHWVLDDNIAHYERMLKSIRVIAKGSFVFRYIEDYVDMFDNIKMAGHNYRMFVVSTNTRLPPIIKNTRVYSSILLSNDLPEDLAFWRGKYNEDVDLSARVLKAGYGTALFNAISADKETTMWSKGGNTDSIYSVENYALQKSQSIVIQHPDIARLTERFGRIHHTVNYTKFKNNEWGYNPDADKPKGEYGMYLSPRPKTGLWSKLGWRDEKKNLTLIQNAV